MCWPSQSDFATLQTRLSQLLIAPTPLAAACYPPALPTGNCTDVQHNWFNSLWRADHPGQMQAPNWEAYISPNGTVLDVCPMNATLEVNCSQGNVPVLGVDARTPKDIQAAVKFAVKHNLRVVIKNTGRTPVAVLTVGAGVQWFEAYDAVYAHGRDIVGGVTSMGSVGSVGGWIGGGGHSILAPKYGLGVDNAVQFTIVTSTGEHLTANAHHNSDLYWALRGLGGGSGTYGVVTSVSYQTHPAKPLVGGPFTAVVISTTNSTADKLIEGNYQRVADTSLTQVTNASYYLVAGGAVAKADPDSAGINPARHKALVHTVAGHGWANDASLENIISAKEKVKGFTRSLERLSPASGAYFNEASLYYADPKQTFFGPHYEKLLAIKKKYDPHDLFVVTQGVGSDECDPSLTCRV
ncbi:hypothetical protein BDY19DRAFT_988669 [Irpex rosettiformis]|uniref:Uncharacterized protein n=1 Tax=Irpex rosettiformis TaxID=378272 RepID=A0ACB8UKI5_9APHY|nr:hypothetical protein BDY19DRAFT_988669 [Irpex rosettiformis]